MQFIFSARVRNNYEPLGLSATLRIPIPVTIAVDVLNWAWPPSAVRHYYDQRDHVQECRSFA